MPCALSFPSQSNSHLPPWRQWLSYFFGPRDLGKCSTHSRCSMNSTWFRDSTGRESKFTYRCKQGLWSEGQPIQSTQQEVLTSWRRDLESDTTWGLALPLEGIRTWMCILTRLWEDSGRPPGSRPEATLVPSRGQVCGHLLACQLWREVVWPGLREAVITSLMKEEQKEEERIRRAFVKNWYAHSAAPACFWNPSIPMTRPVCDLCWGKSWVGMGARPLGREMKGKRGWGQKEGAKSVQRETGQEEKHMTGSPRGLAGHCISEQQHAKGSGTTTPYSSQKHSSLHHTSATQKAGSHVFISLINMTGHNHKGRRGQLLSFPVHASSLCATTLSSKSEVLLFPL